jgi:hypothetical protein
MADEPQPTEDVEEEEEADKGASAITYHDGEKAKEESATT